MYKKKKNDDLLLTVYNLTVAPTSRSSVIPPQYKVSRNLTIEMTPPELIFSSSMLVFPPTYAGSKSKLVLHIANKSKSSAYLDTEPIKNECFSAEPKSLMIPGGSSRSISVYFRPKTSEMYEGSLNFKKDSTASFLLSGKGMCPMLKLANPTEEAFVFRRGVPSSSSFDIENTNPTESLLVNVSSTSPAIKVAEHAFEMAPSSTHTIYVEFDPSQDVEPPVYLLFDVPETGEKLKKELFVHFPSDLVKIDFELVPIGTRITKEYPESQIQRNIPLSKPFYVSDDAPKGVTSIGFYSLKPGFFQTKLYEETRTISIQSEAIVLPFNFDDESLRLVNISDTVISLRVSIENNTASVFPGKVKLAPEGWVILSLIEPAHSKNEEHVIVITYRRDDGKSIFQKFKYSFPIPIRPVTRTSTTKRPKSIMKAKAFDPPPISFQEPETKKIPVSVPVYEERCPISLTQEATLQFYSGKEYRTRLDVRNNSEKDYLLFLVQPETCTFKVLLSPNLMILEARMNTQIELSFESSASDSFSQPMYLVGADVGDDLDVSETPTGFKSPIPVDDLEKALILISEAFNAVDNAPIRTALETCKTITSTVITKIPTNKPTTLIVTPQSMFFCGDDNDYVYLHNLVARTITYEAYALQSNIKLDETAGTLQAFETKRIQVKMLNGNTGNLEIIGDDGATTVKVEIPCPTEPSSLNEDSLILRPETLDFGPCFIDSEHTINIVVVNRFGFFMNCNVKTTHSSFTTQDTIRLKPIGRQHIGVTFLPKESTKYEAALEISSNNFTQRVILRGVGVDRI